MPEISIAPAVRKRAPGLLFVPVYANTSHTRSTAETLLT
jgi:hypothetical protein